MLTMTPPDVTGYGRVLIEDGGVRAIIEDKDCTPSGTPRSSSATPAPTASAASVSTNIDKVTNDNAQGEYYLTDMVGIYVGMGEPVSAVHCDDYEELLGVNDRVQLAQVTKIMQRRINGRSFAGCLDA